MKNFLAWIFRYNRRKTISRVKADILRDFIKKAEKYSAKQRIIEYDKIYHHTLKDMGYFGTFGDILKIYPKEIPDLNKIWQFHKLRNSLVHELKVQDEEFLGIQALRYKGTLELFIEQVTKK